MDDGIVGGEKPDQEIRSNVGGARPGAGRPAFVPTEEEQSFVEKLSGYGLQQESIAALVRDGIHIDTLRTHFKRELEVGRARANGKVGKTLFDKAMAGDTGSLIWWTKTQMRWAETQKHEIVHTGISINDALEAAKARLISGDVIDATIVEPRKLEDGSGQGET